MIEKRTAAPAPTKNGQAGVLRILRALATMAGPAATTIETTLRAAHQMAERYGSTRNEKSVAAINSPFDQLKPARLAASTGISAPRPLTTLRNGRRRAKYTHTIDRPSQGAA